MYVNCESVNSIHTYIATPVYSIYMSSFLQEFNKFCEVVLMCTYIPSNLVKICHGTIRKIVVKLQIL